MPSSTQSCWQVRKLREGSPHSSSTAVRCRGLGPANEFGRELPAHGHACCAKVPRWMSRYVICGGRTEEARIERVGGPQFLE